MLFWTAAHLSRSVPCVPQGIPEVFSSTGGRIDHFEWNSGNSKGLRGLVLPVCLCDLFPHDHIEARARLVSKHEACIVVVPVSVHIHGPAEVHGAELVKACDERKTEKTGWRVSGLQQWNLKSNKLTWNCWWTLNKCTAYPLRCLGQSWQSEPALCPDVWLPS